MHPIRESCPNHVADSQSHMRRESDPRDSSPHSLPARPACVAHPPASGWHPRTPPCPFSRAPHTPATAAAMWVSSLYIFSVVFDVSRSCRPGGRAGRARRGRGASDLQAQQGSLGAYQQGRSTIRRGRSGLAMRTVKLLREAPAEVGGFVGSVGVRSHVGIGVRQEKHFTHSPVFTQFLCGRAAVSTCGAR